MSAGGSPRIPFEEGVGLGVLDDALGVAWAHRGDPEGDVLKEVDVDASESEHDHWAELGVAAHAYDHLPALRHHLVDGDAVYLRLWVRLAALLHYLGECLAHHARGVVMLRTTPPMSVLWSMSGETIFMTTG